MTAVVKKLEPAHSAPTYHRTDMGNGQRFSVMYRGKAHYCYPWKRWLVYDGKRWAIDKSGAIHWMCKAVVRTIYKEASQVEDDAKRQEVVKWAVKSEKKTALDAMRQCAESEPGIPIQPEELDANPWLLNLENGTLDLETGGLRQHDPHDMITKVSPVVYDADAGAPTWEKYLEEVLEPQDAAFLQRAAGYSLTGDTSEQCLFFLYGGGANGKSVFVNMLRRILGDLCTQTDFSAFLVKNGGGIPNDIARLVGARLVVANELAEGQRLNEVVVKQLTGNDTVTARFLHREFFEFVPAFKLWLVGNHLPEITGTDHAIWRRLRMVRFPRTIPDHRQDRHLEERLSHELPGIFNWMLDGLKAWREHGLQPPESVTQGVSEYRAEGDHVQRFINNECIRSDSAWVRKNELFDQYTQWCEGAGVTALSERTFGKRIQGYGVEEGFRKVCGKSARVWNGIGHSLRDLRDHGSICVTGQVIEIIQNSTG